MNDQTPSSTRIDWRVRIGVPVSAILLRLLFATWRVEVRGEAAWRGRWARGEGNVLALWHGHLLPLTHYFRGFGIKVLVSEHRDGEIIARVLQQMGYDLIRGSTTRGGARAFAEMVKALKGGASIAITPDGPRGPAEQFTPGAAVAASKAGVPITAAYVTADRVWRLGSWDRFMIPKPFARVVYHLSDPAFVQGTTPAEIANESARFAALVGPRAAGAGSSD